jgi:serine phosphatase RsbU (regulator of sigma subunit)
VIVLGYLLPAAHNYTDIVERARRERPLELPAEMQWSMLPIRAYSCGPFSLAGQLVPAYEVGGDLFDYAVQTDELFVTVIDAMGHGLRASLLGTLAITALRNARRTGLALADQLRQADRVLHSQFGGEQLVTALACGSTPRPAPRRSSTPVTRLPTSSATG